MLSRRKPPKSGIERAARRNWPRHRQFVRGFVCVVNDPECSGRIECCHARGGTNGGAQLKPHDAFTLPMCSHHHNLQTTRGEAWFERTYGIDMEKEATKLARVSPVPEVREFIRSWENRAA